MNTETREKDRSLYGHGMLTGWFVLMLILLFAGLSIALIIFGAKAQRTIEQHAQHNAAQRASVSYALSRVQAYDVAGAIRIERMEIDGQDTCVLIFGEDIDGDLYETRMYCAGGMLREQTVCSDIPLESAEDGEPIAALDALEAEREGRLLTLHMTHTDGTRQSVHAALHCAEEGAP